jgi:uncharacterized integral membrane protein (TIGR00697 family)
MTYLFIALLLTISATALACMCARWFGNQILGPLLAGSVVTSIFIAEKLGTIAIPGLGEYAITVSILIYSSTFLITDVISELEGRAAAQRAVLGTALCYPLVLLTTQLGVHWAPSSFYNNQVAFDSVMSFAGRVTLASLVSYLVSQSLDVWVFHRIKAATGSRHLWLRNNGSTLLSQGVDTVIFYSLAFLGTVPIATLLQLMVLGYLLKLVIALVDTPFVYGVIRGIRGPGVNAEPTDSSRRS